MARPAKDPADRKVKITTRLDPELLQWAHDNVGPGKRFGSVTHALETGLLLLREREGGAPSRVRSSTSKK